MAGDGARPCAVERPAGGYASSPAAVISPPSTRKNKKDFIAKTLDIYIYAW